MVIDDNKIDTLIVEKMVINYNIASEVITMDDALSALHYLHNQNNIANYLPEVIFLDINMPEFDGFYFLKEFELLPEELKNKCKIIMLTSSINDQDRSRSEGNKYVKGFITKPLTYEKLKAALGT